MQKAHRTPPGWSHAHPHTDTITPTSNNSSLADSIAKGMGTDTKHMFGEHKMLRTWGKKGAYSAAGEADGARRAEAGICEYWTWVFGKKQNKRKRV